jgi:hypothetical protein
MTEGLRPKGAHSEKDFYKKLGDLGVIAVS